MSRLIRSNAPGASEEQQNSAAREQAMRLSLYGDSSEDELWQYLTGPSMADTLLKQAKGQLAHNATYQQDPNPERNANTAMIRTLTQLDR